MTQTMPDWHMMPDVLKRILMLGVRVVLLMFRHMKDLVHVICTTRSITVMTMPGVGLCNPEMPAKRKLKHRVMVCTGIHSLVIIIGATRKLRGSSTVQTHTLHPVYTNGRVAMEIDAKWILKIEILIQVVYIFPQFYP